MPVVNPAARELVFKIVYYGPGLGGKTTTLQHIHKSARPERRGRLVSLATPVDRTLYFDFLPLRLPTIRELGVRLQLFTVPGQVHYDATRRLVLTGADGVVMVVDSQEERLDANLESLDNLKENLAQHGRSFEQVPFALQYNKRDLPGVLGVAELDAALNATEAPAFPTVAVSGEGVYESLEAVVQAILREFRRQLPRSDSDAPSLAEPEQGLAAAVRASYTEEELAAELARASRASEQVVARVGSAARQGIPSGTDLRLRRSPAPPPPSSVPPKPKKQSPGRPSFASLFPAQERTLVEAAEFSLANHDVPEALRVLDRLASRVLASLAAALGAGSEAVRDPTLLVLVLGVPAKRYLRFRRWVRHSRKGQDVELEQGLEAFLFVLELTRLRDSL